MRPFSLLIKPSGPDCNINCEYCFYNSKCVLFGEGKHRMGDEVLECLIKDYLALDMSVSCFAWQGGEPTLMGLDFYRKVIELQKKFGKAGQSVSNSLQTNGTLLDDDWCKFLNEYNWLVGISLDGPKDLHDYYRQDYSGNGTWDRVMQGVNSLKRNRVEFNVLTLLNDKNVKEPDRIFDFFVEHKIKFWQFVPCVEKDPETNEIAEFSVKPEEYGQFICRLFDRWYEYGPEKISIRLFESLLSRIVHGQHTNCTFSKKCDDYIVIEHNGNAYCCDFFVTDECKLGNILEDNIGELANCERKRKFALEKTKLANKCLICRYCDICRGGCLKDRMVLGDSVKTPSYLCGAYKQIFEYVMPKLTQLAATITSK